MTTAPTPEEVHALAARLEHCVAKWGKQNALSLEAYSAVKMMRRLQAEKERLLTQIHKLEMDALDLASESSILKRAEESELEARKPLPLPLSDEQLRAEFIPWAEIQYRHEDEFTVRDFKICLAAWSAGRRITGGLS